MRLVDILADQDVHHGQPGSGAVSFTDRCPTARGQTTAHHELPPMSKDSSPEARRGGRGDLPARDDRPSRARRFRRCGGRDDERDDLRGDGALFRHPAGVSGLGALALGALRAAGAGTPPAGRGAGAAGAAAEAGRAAAGGDSDRSRSVPVPRRRPSHHARLRAPLSHKNWVNPGGQVNSMSRACMAATCVQNGLYKAPIRMVRG